MTPLMKKIQGLQAQHEATSQDPASCAMKTKCFRRITRQVQDLVWQSLATGLETH